MNRAAVPVALLPVIAIPLLLAFGDSRAFPVGAGLYVAALIVWTLGRRLSFERLRAAAIGALGGILIAFLCLPLVHSVADSRPGQTILALCLYAISLVVGVALALEKIPAASEAPSGEAEPPPAALQKICDTSVLIDGRLADMAQAGFIDGELLIPQFILRELQGIADSSEQLKRNRGRRGLDIVRRLQDIPGIKVSIPSKDYPEEREVDHKLMLLANDTGASLVTNDFNLNKLARVRSIKVLNLNDLVNSLKTIYLPGEEIQITISRAGKEQGQGIAYLDDGTMVVVDSGAAHVGHQIKAVVTNIHQTTAGRMIFTRFEEVVSKRGHSEDKSS